MSVIIVVLVGYLVTSHSPLHKQESSQSQITSQNSDAHTSSAQAQDQTQTQTLAESTQPSTQPAKSICSYISPDEVSTAVGTTVVHDMTMEGMGLISSCTFKTSGASSYLDASYASIETSGDPKQVFDNAYNGSKSYASTHSDQKVSTLSGIGDKAFVNVSDNGKMATVYFVKNNHLYSTMVLFKTHKGVAPAGAAAAEALAKVYASKFNF